MGSSSGSRQGRQFF